MSKNGNRMLLLAAAVILGTLLGGCKAEEEIVNVPTPKVEQQTILLEREKEPAEHYFEVVGNGEILAAPDFATLTMRASTQGETAEAAAAVCQEEVQKLIDAAEQFRISKNDIVQSGIEIEPKYAEDETTVTAYQASDVLTITIRVVSRTETILTSLVDAGNYEVQSLTYSITESSEAYRQALATALDDAKGKAEALAESAGVHLGDVIGISETAYDETKLIGMAFESSAIAVNAQVTVRFKID